MCYSSVLGGLFKQIRMNKHTESVWAMQTKKKVYGKIHHSYRDNTKDTFIRFPGTFICIGYSNSLTNQENPPK